MPSVSVIIPAYNHRDHIVAALESVRAQTFTDYEIIVVNDGSPDDTAAVLAPYVESGKIHTYIEQENAGQGAARNRGIAASRGEFIALLDDDDLWPPDKLEWQVAALRANPEANLIYGCLELIDGDGRPTTPPDPLPCVGPESRPPAEGDVFPRLIRENWIVSPGQCLLRKSALDALTPAPFDPGIWGADDWDLWLRLTETGGFLYVPRPALCYRLHRGNASRHAIRLRENCLKLLQKHVRRNAGDPARGEAARRSYAWWREQTVEHFYHLAWMDTVGTGGSAAVGTSGSTVGAGGGREALKKLAFVARIAPRFTLTRRFLGLLLQAGRLAARKGDAATPEPGRAG